MNSLVLVIILTFFDMPPNLAPPSVAPFNWERVENPFLFGSPMWRHLPTGDIWINQREWVLLKKI